ncbi:hypothetical protein PGIGA_G00130500 [Pangasianodon gigas]|uniref:Uncharacterized protein n=1 Tax=Pangasianodon gigas TaxID=30993 RepID=A0ACC5XID7_PANGG|nr:hypothetical protein [Pangasianodon gigas]
MAYNHMECIRVNSSEACQFNPLLIPDPAVLIDVSRTTRSVSTFPTRTVSLLSPRLRHNARMLPCFQRKQAVNQRVEV